MGKAKREYSAWNVLRNEPCPCESGKKFKKCCWLDDFYREVFTSNYPEPYCEFMIKEIKKKRGE